MKTSLFSTKHVLPSPIREPQHSEIGRILPVQIESDDDWISTIQSSTHATFQNPALSPSPMKNKHMSESTPKFTSSMKERNSSADRLFTDVEDGSTQGKLLLDSSEDEFKENTPIKRDKNPYSKPPNRSLLKKGQEKSQGALCSKSFYATSQSTYGGFSLYSSVGDKRKPGMLNPYPNKRPRLAGNINYTWRPNLAKSKPSEQSTLRGFSNLGNTCYMNAILQALYSLDSFRSDLIQSRRSLQKLLAKDSLLYSLSCLFVAQSRDMTREKKNNALKSIKGAISTSAKRFSGNEQHDAHEFLSQILDQLKEDINRLNMATPSPTRDADLITEVVNKTQENPIMTNFEFCVQHSFTCAQCGEVIVKDETFHDLAIDLPRKSKIHNRRSLQDALNQFFGKETLEYKCEECGGMESKVTHHFTRLPRVLILHLKRYHYYSLAQKVACPVFIPKFMTLQLCCNEDTIPAPPPSDVKENYPVTFSPVKHIPSQEQPRRKLDYSPERKRPFNFKRPFTSRLEDGSSIDEGRMKKAMEQSLEICQKEDPDFWKAIEMSKTTEKKATTVSSDEDDQLAKAIQMSIRESKANVETDEDEELKKALELSLQDCAKSDEEIQFIDENDSDTGFTNLDENEAETLQRLADNAELLQQVADNSETGDMAYSYRLVSVVSHIGSMSSAGHYVSDVYDMKKRSWLKCDDSYVQKTDETTVRESREKTGYIFFYLSKDVFGDLESCTRVSSS